MRNWRVITAIATVAFAALAAVLAYKYLNNADERARDKVALVPVLVATSDIGKGTSADEAVSNSAVEVVQIQRRSVPDSAFRSATPLQGKDFVAASNIDKGQFITKASFVAKTSLGRFADQVPKGRQAISFSVDQPHGVAAFITPGDSINLLATITAKDPTNKVDQGQDTTAFLIPGAKVLAVGSTTQVSPQATEPTPAPGSAPTSTTAPPAQVVQNLGLITVSVTPRQAEQIAHAVNGAAQLYLSLNAPGFDPKTFTTPVEIVEAYNFFDQPLDYLKKIQGTLPRQ